MSSREFVMDGFALIGAAATVYGFHLAWHPLGWIVGGLLGLGIAASMARLGKGE